MTSVPGGEDVILRDTAMPAFREGDEVDLFTPSLLAKSGFYIPKGSLAHISLDQRGSEQIIDVPAKFLELVYQSALRFTKTERQRKFEADRSLFEDESIQARASAVKPGHYEVVEGSAEIVYRDNKLFIVDLTDDKESREYTPGVQIRGHWTNWQNQRFPVVSFLYHKLDSNGKLETKERMIILTGVGYGEHPGHKGQPAAWYLVGPEIGKLDPQDKSVDLSLPIENTVMSAKNFSVDCITNGPFDQPVLANPKI